MAVGGRSPVRAAAAICALVGSVVVMPGAGAAAVPAAKRPPPMACAAIRSLGKEDKAWVIRKKATTRDVPSAFPVPMFGGKVACIDQIDNPEIGVVARRRTESFTLQQMQTDAVFDARSIVFARSGDGLPPPRMMRPPMANQVLCDDGRPQRMVARCETTIDEGRMFRIGVAMAPTGQGAALVAIDSRLFGDAATIDTVRAPVLKGVDGKSYDGKWIPHQVAGIVVSTEALFDGVSLSAAVAGATPDATIAFIAQRKDGGDPVTKELPARYLVTNLNTGAGFALLMLRAGEKAGPAASGNSGPAGEPAKGAVAPAIEGVGPATGGKDVDAGGAGSGGGADAGASATGPADTGAVVAPATEAPAGAASGAASDAASGAASGASGEPMAGPPATPEPAGTAPATIGPPAPSEPVAPTPGMIGPPAPAPSFPPDDAVTAGSPLTAPKNPNGAAAMSLPPDDSVTSSPKK